MLKPRPYDNLLVSIAKRTIRRFIAYDITRSAAALAYFFFLSLFPFLLLLGAIIGLFNIAPQDITAMLSHILPSDIALLLSEYVDTQRMANTPTLPTSLIFTLLSASGAVRALMRAVNNAYSALGSAEYANNPRGFVKTNIIALSFTAALGLTLALCTAFISLAGAPLSLAAEHFGISADIVLILRVGGWCVVVAAAFAVLLLAYYVMPAYRTASGRKARLRQALPGAAAATVGLLALSLGFSLYIDNFSTHTAVYGIIGAVMALLLLLFLTGIVLIAGAHINVIYKMHSAEKYRNLT